MTCKDCMHYEAHSHFAPFFRFNDENVENLCPVFLAKSKYIELPCKAEDVVYIIEPFNGICDMTLRNARVNDVLKNNIFLTKSEAEQKLKELNNG